jgi:hypothetical protein
LGASVTVVGAWVTVVVAPVLPDEESEPELVPVEVESVPALESVPVLESTEFDADGEAESDGALAGAEPELLQPASNNTRSPLATAREPCWILMPAQRWRRTMDTA